MTPPSTAAGRRLRRSPVPHAPRRISGPARAPRATARPVPLRAAAATAGIAAPFALRIGVAARRLPDARLLDRLIRGRAWIALVAVLLLGIVFMQVSMLKLNTGISNAITAESTLERENSALRAQISQLGSGERIQQVAAQAGMLMPPAGTVRFLDARSADALSAAANIAPPNPVTPSAPLVPAAGTVTPSSATIATPTATGTAAAAPAAAPTTATTPTPAATAPTAAVPATTAPSQQPTTSSATPASTPTTTTGAVAAPSGSGQ